MFCQKMKEKMSDLYFPEGFTKLDIHSIVMLYPTSHIAH